MPRASGPHRLQFGDDVEAVAVAEPHVDHGEGRRVLRDRGETLGDRFGAAHGKAPALHAAHQPREERLVVIDDQQRPVLSERGGVGPGKVFGGVDRARRFVVHQ